MTKNKEKEILIANLKGTNRSLLKRMIAILIFLVIGLGFHFNKWSSLREADKLVSDQYLLKELKDSCNSNEYLNNVAWDMALEDRSLDWLSLSFRFTNDSLENIAIIDSVNLKVHSELDKLWTRDLKEVSLLGFKITEFTWKLLSTVGFVLLFMNFARILRYRDELVNKLLRNNVQDWEIGSEIYEFYTPYNEFKRSWIPTFGSLTFVFFLSLVVFTSLILGVDFPHQMTTNEDFFIGIVNMVLSVILAIEVIQIGYRQNLLGIKSITNIIKGKVYSDKRHTLQWYDFLRWSLLPIIICTIATIEILSSTNSRTNYLFIPFVIIVCATLPLSMWLHRQKKNNLSRSLVNTGLLMNILYIFQIILVPQQWFNLEDDSAATFLVFMLSGILNYLYFVLKRK